MGEYASQDTQRLRRQNLRNRKDSKKNREEQSESDQSCVVRVGVRGAFGSEKVKHAVIEINGKIFGLSGDMGTNFTSEDPKHKPEEYTWCESRLELDKMISGKDFLCNCQEYAKRMKYNLVGSNCFTPIYSSLYNIKKSSGVTSTQSETVDKVMKWMSQWNFAGLRTRGNFEPYRGLSKKDGPPQEERKGVKAL